MLDNKYKMYVKIWSIFCFKNYRKQFIKVMKKIIVYGLLIKIDV